MITRVSVEGKHGGGSSANTLDPPSPSRWYLAPGYNSANLQ